MIPSDRISPQAFRLLQEYLRTEIPQALSERRPLEERWLRYQQLYQARPEKAVKDFPFVGASNLVVPVIATDVDTIYSRLMGVLFGPENLWSCSPLREDMVDYAPRLQEFLAWAQKAELDAYDAVADWLLEICKLGTGVLKERYRRESRIVYEFRETVEGTVDRLSRQLTKDNPSISAVSCFDFLVPAGTVKLEDAPWCAERLLLTWEQLVQRQRMGIYQGLERLGPWAARDRGSWIETEYQRMQHFVQGQPTRLEIWESWTDFDISGIGEPQPLLVSLHLPTQTVLRIDYNPFFHQEKPFDVARYMRQEKAFYGIGIPQMLEMIQEEAVAMHNQRVDANTIANTPMMKAREGIGIKDDEPIFIGRWFLVKEMADIEPMQFGRLPMNTLGEEQLTLSYGSRRTGVNDYVMGNNSPSVGYAAAQTNIMQHQEAAKRFDQTLREIRVSLSSAGRRVTELYQQFNQGGKAYMVMGEGDGEVVNRILQFPYELVRNVVAIDVTATSASLNKDVQIRTSMVLMQLVTQYYEQMIQSMMLAVNPQVPPQIRMLAQQMVVGGTTLMRRVMDAYDMQDIDSIIPDLRELVLGQSQQLEQLGGPPAGIWPGPQDVGATAGFGGGGAPAGTLPFGGMAAFPPGAG